MAPSLGWFAFVELGNFGFRSGAVNRSLPRTSLSAIAACACLLLIEPSNAQLSPESACDLDGKPVEPCVRFLREAAALADAGDQARLIKQANEAWIAAKAKRDARPAMYSFPEETADDRRQPPLERYRSHLQFGLIACKLSLTTALGEAELGKKPTAYGDFGGCVSSASRIAKELYDRAAPTIKKAGAKQALKEVHVAFATALQGINPGQGETKINYTSRQAALEDRLNAALARFDVER